MGKITPAGVIEAGTVVFVQNLAEAGDPAQGGAQVVRNGIAEGLLSVAAEMAIFIAALFALDVI